MSTEMHVLAPYSFYGEVFESKYDVEKVIKETQEGLDEAKSALYKLAYMTEPQKFIPQEYDGTPEEWVDERIKAIIHDIGVAEVDLYKYNVLLEYWDKFHTIDGNIITIPKDMRDKQPIWDVAFGEGDWLNIVYPDGSEVDD